jgi:hypothetical protein
MENDGLSMQQQQRRVVPGVCFERTKVSAFGETCMTQQPVSEAQLGMNRVECRRYICCDTRSIAWEYKGKSQWPSVMNDDSDIELSLRWVSFRRKLVLPWRVVSAAFMGTFERRRTFSRLNNK